MQLPYRVKRDSNRQLYLAVDMRGAPLVENALLNKGTAWPQDERERLGLTGILPPAISTEQEQLVRAYRSYSAVHDDLERYINLQALQDRNEVLFYRLLIAHLKEMLPVVYTPTVGLACQEFHRIFRRTRGVYVSADHAPDTAQLIRNATRSKRVSLAVVTDGERILGLGDLGANGMGIPIGKLSLYVAAGGFNPAQLLPILLDTGTDNKQLRSDPLYLGSRMPRLRGDDYDQVVAQFVAGFKQACPGALLQFEDFGKGNAFRLLERYRNDLPSFNDDIQGTGAVTLAAVASAGRLLERPLRAQRFLLVGAGGAGVGVARALSAALEQRHCDHIFMRDSRGLVTDERTGLELFKAEFAADSAGLDRKLLDPTLDLAETIRLLRPTVLIGTTGQPGLFDRSVVEAMSEVTPRPLILPLSNPSASSEADPGQVLEWSRGAALLATGSPFDLVKTGGRTHVIAQCNNVFIFPGIGLAARATGCRVITDSMFARAALALAETVSQSRLEQGGLLPSVQDIREATIQVAMAASREAVDRDVADGPAPDEEAIRRLIWEPDYLPVRYEGG